MMFIVKTSIAEQVDRSSTQRSAPQPVPNKAAFSPNCRWRYPACIGRHTRRRFRLQQTAARSHHSTFRARLAADLD